MNLLYFQDFSITTLRPIYNYWADATLGADGVTWLDSYGAAVNITVWYPGTPENPPRQFIFIVGNGNGQAYDWYNSNTGQIKLLTLCATVPN